MRLIEVENVFLVIDYVLDRLRRTRDIFNNGRWVAKIDLSFSNYLTKPAAFGVSKAFISIFFTKAFANGKLRSLCIYILAYVFS